MRHQRRSMLSSATSQRATLLAAPEEGRIIARSACMAELCAARHLIGLASFWFWILVQRTPFWYTLVEGDPPSYTPALGPDGYCVGFATASAVVAAVARNASELLVGHRQWVWPASFGCARSAREPVPLVADHRWYFIVVPARRRARPAGGLWPVALPAGRSCALGRGGRHPRLLRREGGDAANLPARGACALLGAVAPRGPLV